MKIVILATTALVLLAVTFGSPFPVKRPAIGNHWGSPHELLPMTFAHKDHTDVACTECHHNYVDDTGLETCMLCHVTDERVAHLLMTQFHELCMGCHVDTQLAGDAAGPTRSCIACHMSEDDP